MKNTKKGFTLVELLVVIAIVAILATVAIIGYTSFIDKAEKSADQQGVAQMNTVLNAAQASESLIVEGNDPATAINIFKVLTENGYNNELVAYYEKYDFGYVVENGKALIVLVENGKVVYPEEQAGKVYKEFFKSVENADELVEAFNTGYVLLKTDAVFTDAITINNDLTIVGNQKILNDNNMTTDNSANSIVNVYGATEDITINMSGVSMIKENAQIYGRGLNLKNNTGKVTIILDDVDLKSYYYALNIATGNTGGVEIIVRNSTITGWAAVNVWSKVNVTFENCTLIGEQRSSENFGTIVVVAEDQGSTAKGSTFTFKNCTIEATGVTEGSGMKLLSVRSDADFTFEGCTFKVNGEVSDLTYSLENGVTANITIDGVAK